MKNEVSKITSLKGIHENVSLRGLNSTERPYVELEKERNLILHADKYLEHRFLIAE